MKVKVGQRRFLLRNGYTDEKIDKMTAGTARSIISALEEKNRKAKSEEDTDLLIQEMFATLVSEGCENPHALYAFCIAAINEGYRKVR